MTWDFGKTIQMLSVIVDYVQNEQEKEDMIPGQEQLIVSNSKRASLVVSPSSLTLNWQNEAKKFAGELKTLVIRGTLSKKKTN